MRRSDGADCRHRIPNGYRAAFIVLSLLALLFGSWLGLAVVDATYRPHEATEPETGFCTPATEVIYPSRGAVGIWWNGTWTVIGQVTWLERTGANDGYSEYSSNECGASGR